MVISQGDVWWAELNFPLDPGRLPPAGCCCPGKLFESQPNRYGDCIPLTSNLKWAEAPGNVRLSSRATGLPQDSVANVSQIISLDKGLLTEQAGRPSPSKLSLVLSGIDVVLGK